MSPDKALFFYKNSVSTLQYMEKGAAKFMETDSAGRKNSGYG